MKLIDSFIIAIRSLLVNKLRSALTMLGIIIGVGAVITLMSVGRGAEATITSTFEQMGTNVLSVVPRSPEVGGVAGISPVFSTPSLTLDDAKALEAVPLVEGVVPVNENFIEVNADGEKKVAIIHGATPEYQRVYNYSLDAGQFISDKNIATRDLVIVLGSEVAQDLFGSTDLVGQKVKIKGYRFTIIGVLKAKGGAMMGFSLDNVVVIPITTYQSKLFTLRTAKGEDAVQSIAVKLADAGATDLVKADIETILKKRHRIAAGDKNDFAVVSPQQVTAILSQITGIFTLFLAAIAGISLLVGGIGIMNIMLVSVTERTREIGIRKAIGAKRRDILLQFLFEAGVLSLIGGSVGIVGGWLLATLISQIANIAGGMNLRAVVSPDIVILAVSVSIIIGLVSGMYPAMRAARLNPIDALHYG